MVVFTYRVHGHFGIYSTLGAKMGLFAREQFEASGIREYISVNSYAGSVPPVSCLNDGLQISTGATLGHGLIDISDEPQKRVEAVFTSGGKALRIALKPEYESMIRQDIEDATRLYGRSPEYWKRVRNLALKYWLRWNRNSIFQLL